MGRWSVTPARSREDRLIIELETTYDLFTPDPETSYILWELNYDHNRSVEGPSSDGGCGDVSQMMVTNVAGWMYDGQLQEHLLILACDQVFWNFEDMSTIHCDGTQIEEFSWGRIKTLYR